jgi:hypothetical protein
VMILLSALLYVDFTSMERISKKVSPNRHYEIHHYQNISDYDLHSPYGDYLFLSRPSRWRSPRDGYVIFAAICAEPPNYVWVDDENIEITCKESKYSRARTVVSRAFDIDISFKNGNPRP